MNKITVVGAGYVGLSLATLLSQDNNVFLLEIDQKRVELINNKVSPIKDEYIEDYFANKTLNLVATNDINEAFQNTKLVIIATPTNYDVETNCFDTTSVEQTIENVLSFDRNIPIVIKSTIPIGFTSNIKNKYNDSAILFSPEFLREGKALFDNLYPSRIVVGIDKNNNRERDVANMFAKLLEESSLKEKVDIFVVGSSEAEAIKLFSNTYLALRIAYFNELDSFAMHFGLDSSDIINGVCSDPRIGNHYNNPSFGYGGYCLPKDTKQLCANFQGVPESLISSVIESNAKRKETIISDIDKRLRSSKEGIVGVYRLTMKSNSDNFREAAIFDVISGLKAKGYKIMVFEPQIKEQNNFNDLFALENNFNNFVKECSLIIENRYDDILADSKNIVYTRDLFNRD